MQFDRGTLDNSQLIHLYEQLLFPRMIEEKMLVLLRQGKISKWFSGMGQEAISVGVAQALQSHEMILPMHRNLGVFTSREVPLYRLFCQFMGKKDGFTKGRDRSFHFGSLEHNIVGMISHLGPQLPVTDGLALASKIKKEKEVVAVFSGDGGTSEGDFHEALNIASVWKLPVIFIIENNGYGLSTPNDEQFNFDSFVHKGPAYGMDAVRVDGNNILDVYHLIKRHAEDIRNHPRPLLVEAMTFRMRGHEEASGTKYVPQELFDEWAEKDPIKNYQQYLMQIGVLTEGTELEIRNRLQKEIDKSWQDAFQAADPEVSSETELNDVYAPVQVRDLQPQEPDKNTEKRMIDAIHDTLEDAMIRDEHLILMGQDIAAYGGVFKATEGFIDTFGRERIINTPLCESGILGVATGLSLAGIPSMVEMQFADFVSSGFTQIVNYMAKLHYRWGHAPNVVIRMPTGAGVGAGPFHSQSNEAWFAHTPGLKIVYPSNPADAKGLLHAAFNDPNPVMYFEHKALYRSATAPVPDEYYETPIGEAAVVARGEKGVIVTYGMGVIWAQRAIQHFPEHTWTIIDLRTLIPWDKEFVLNHVKNVGKVLILQEDIQLLSMGSEIASTIAEEAFEYLDGPVVRVSSLDTPVPFNQKLEQNFLAVARLQEKMDQLLAY